MGENQELERGIIPAGTRIKLYEGSITILEDTVVDANQEWIDKAIEDQDNYFKGCNIYNQSSKDEYTTIHSPTGSVKIKRSKSSL